MHWRMQAFSNVKARHGMCFGQRPWRQSKSRNLMTIRKWTTLLARGISVAKISCTGTLHNKSGSSATKNMESCRRLGFCQLMLVCSKMRGMQVKAATNTGSLSQRTRRVGAVSNCSTGQVTCHAMASGSSINTLCILTWSMGSSTTCESMSWLVHSIHSLCIWTMKV